MARERLGQVASSETHREQTATHLASQFAGSESEGNLLNDLRMVISAHKCAEIRYRSAQTPAGAARKIDPYGVIFSKGKWFLVGLCRAASEIRLFRVDRIKDISLLDEECRIPEHFDLSLVLNSKGVVGQAEEEVVVTYSAAIARWIAEREGAGVLPDGTAEVAYPLFDEEWAVRHVLQYATEAIVRSPTRLTRRIRRSLAALS